MTGKSYCPGYSTGGAGIARLAWEPYRLPRLLMSKAESPTAQAEASVAKYDRLLSQFATSGFPPLIIAVGLSNQLLDALDRHRATSKVLALEPVPATYRQRMARPEWRWWMDSGRLTVLTAPDYEGFQDAWRLIARDALQPPMLVDPELMLKHPAQTEGAKAVAKHIVRGARANEEARKRLAGQYLLNTLRNLPAIASEGNAAALARLFSGIPAIVVGAGPSLDANLAALRDLRDCALVIAVDTAVRPLLAAGIRPHLVVSVDPSEANGRHLNDLPDARDLWLVAEGSLTPSVFPQFKGRTFIYKVSNHEPWPWLAEHGADCVKLRTWGSVLTTAFDVAGRSGCNPIVFAGADLAYTDGLQYCRNTVYEPDWRAFPTNAERAAEFAKYLQIRPHVTHRDIRGGATITTPHFIQFRDWIVAHAGSVAPRRVINGTGAGILNGGAVENRELRTLALPALPEGDHDLRTRLARAWSGSTRGVFTVGRNLERALKDGAAIPVQRWLEFAGDATPVDRISEALQAAAAQLAFARD